MYVDAVVLAGMATVVLMVGFMAAFGGFVLWDSRRSKARSALRRGKSGNRKLR